MYIFKLTYKSSTQLPVDGAGEDLQNLFLNYPRHMFQCYWLFFGVVGAANRWECGKPRLKYNNNNQQRRRRCVLCACVHCAQRFVVLCIDNKGRYKNS